MKPQNILIKLIHPYALRCYRREQCNFIGAKVRYVVHCVYVRTYIPGYFMPSYTVLFDRFHNTRIADSPCLNL